MEYRKKDEKMKNIGSMEFWLRDNRDDEYNQSIDCTFELYGFEDGFDDILPIKKYWEMCCNFAAAMGFSEKTIRKWFGDY